MPGDEGAEAPEGPTPSPPEKVTEEATPAPPEETPASEEAAPAPAAEDTSDCDSLYLSAEALYGEARAAFKVFRENETRQNWEKAKELVGQAQEQCDKIVAMDEEYERVHELARSCNNLRRTLLELEPSE
jgi:hypothetical protein